MDQQYCLRWHNHPTNLTGVLMSLLQREALCDVTLAVEGETIKAHQTILSACSPYFETIFIQNTHPHPIMYLKDVDYVDLKAIIEYMYKGEVNVAQRSLPKFLKTAEGLQVKGLVESNNLNPSSIYRPSSDGDRNSTDTPPNYPSDNNNPSKYENLDRRDIDERSSIIGDKIGDKEAHIEFRDYGDKDMHDAHLDLSPVLDKHSRKRRNPSNCDTPSSLPQTQIPLSRHFSESQASSHSSYKLSPLPKSNSLEADTDGRRKSPVTNSLAGIQQQQQQQISIKQEASDITSGLPLPQVHLNPNPMNQNLLPHLLANDDFLSVSNAIQSNESSENDQQLTQVEQAEREIDGSKAWHMRLTFERLSGGCNLHRCKLCGKVVTHIRNHYHVHFPGRFECPLCRATYTRSDNLRTHCKFKHPMFNPDTRKFENLMNSSIASQTAAIAAIAAANSLNAAASFNVAQSHNQSSE